MTVVLSYDPLANRLESGEKLTAFTVLRWPVKVATGFQLSVFVTMTVLSSDPLANRLESCEKLTARTELVWPVNVSAF